jgi:hypothetical protein
MSLSRRTHKQIVETLRRTALDQRRSIGPLKQVHQPIEGTFMVQDGLDWGTRIREEVGQLLEGNQTFTALGIRIKDLKSQAARPPPESDQLNKIVGWRRKENLGENENV